MADKKLRRGHSLIELVAASFIIAIALAPALQMMRDSLKLSQELEVADMMSTLCVNKLEESLAKVYATWDTTSTSGDFSAQGYPQLKFQVTKSDQYAGGGIPGQLMATTATVWNDANGNNAWDTNEQQVQFASKLSYTVSYKVYESQNQ